MKLELEPVGLGYRTVHPPTGIGLHIDRLSESRGDLSGELTVARAPAGHLMRGRFNLVSMTTRASTAKLLQSRSPIKGEPGWAALLEAFCMEVLDTERQGAEMVTLGEEPARGTPSFLIEPFLLDGNMQTILYADGGTGKSTLAAAVAVSLEAGISAVPGWIIEKERKVLVLDWETDSANWNDLIVGISEGLRIKPPPVRYLPCDRPLTNIVHQVAQRVSEEGIALVIIDSTGHAMPGTREGVDANEGAIRLFKAVRSLGCSALMIDHVPKNQDDGNRGPYGSRYKWNSARAVWELVSMTDEDAGADHHIALLHRKHNLTSKEKPLGLMVHRDGVSIEFKREEATEWNLSSLPIWQQIKHILLRAGEPLNVKEVADQLGTGPKTVAVELNRRKDVFVKVRQEGRSAFWAVKSNNSNNVQQPVRHEPETPANVRSNGTDGSMSNNEVQQPVRHVGVAEKEGGRGMVEAPPLSNMTDPPGHVGEDGTERMGSGEGEGFDSLLAMAESGRLQPDARMDA